MGITSDGDLNQRWEDFAFPSSAAMVFLISIPENIDKNMGLYNAFISVGRAMGPLVGCVLSIPSVPFQDIGTGNAVGFLNATVFGSLSEEGVRYKRTKILSKQVDFTQRTIPRDFKNFRSLGYPSSPSGVSRNAGTLASLGSLKKST